MSDKFNVVMWCMKKGFFGYDRNMKKYCKIHEKSLDSASLRDIISKRAKGAFNFLRVITRIATARPHRKSMEK